MLEHQKVVLRNVSHDEHLFRKELLKSMAWLDAKEIAELRRWLKQHFWESHQSVLADIIQNPIGNRA